MKESKPFLNYGKQKNDLCNVITLGRVTKKSRENLQVHLRNPQVYLGGLK